LYLDRYQNYYTEYKKESQKNMPLYKTVEDKVIYNDSKSIMSQE
jgi:hypothetical protein